MRRRGEGNLPPISLPRSIVPKFPSQSRLNGPATPACIFLMIFRCFPYGEADQQKDDALFIIITVNSRESLGAKRSGCSAAAHIFDHFEIVKIDIRQVIPCVCAFGNKIDYIPYALFIEQNLQRMQDLLASNKFAETIPSVLFVRALT